MAEQKQIYKPTVRWDVHHIPIHQILMDKMIAAAIKGQGGTVSGFKGNPEPAGFGLGRMSSMKEAFDAESKLPPVVLKPFREISGVMYYTILDGRHRFAMSVASGKTHVPAIVQD